MTNFDTHFLHIVVASQDDDCSEASLQDVIQMSSQLKQVSANYKCALVNL